MKNKKLSVRFLTESAVIAALYAAATYLSAAFSLAYGPVQFRLSEALTVLSTLTPAAIPGLTIGCIIGNISSPMGIWDVLFGSAATLLGAVTGRMLRNVQIKKLPVLSSLMPVIFNAVIVGLEIVMLTPVEGGKLPHRVALLKAADAAVVAVAAGRFGSAATRPGRDLAAVQLLGHPRSRSSTRRLSRPISDSE